MPREIQKPKRGDIHPITGLIYWDTLHGVQRWRDAKTIARWKKNLMAAVVRWQKADPERHRAAQKRFREVHGKRRNKESAGYRIEWKKKQRKINPLFRLREAMSVRLAFICRRKVQCGKPAVVRTLGCSIEAFKAHLEKQFKPGMSWDNYGYWGWHVDHRIPLASAKSVAHMKQLFHYTNLQPLWWYENFAKGSKIINK